MSSAQPESDPKEFIIPGALLGIGVVIYLIQALLTRGTTGMGATLIALFVLLAIKVVLGLIACLLAAKFMGCSYGALWSGVLKLAAIFIFPGAVAVLIPIPIFAFIVTVLLYWGLIEKLFDMDVNKTITTVIVITLAQVSAILVSSVTTFIVIALVQTIGVLLNSVVIVWKVLRHK